MTVVMTQEEKKRMLKKFFKWLERKSRMASLEVPKGSLTNIDGEVRYPRFYHGTEASSEDDFYDDFPIPRRKYYRKK